MQRWSEADEFATLRKINGPQFNRLMGLEMQFARTIKHDVSLTVLANRNKRFSSAPADAEAALSHEFSKPFLLPKSQSKLPPPP